MTWDMFVLPLFKIAILVLLIFELCYYAYVKLILVPRLETPCQRHTIWFKKPFELVGAVYALLETSSSYTFEDFLSGFCLKQDVSKISSHTFERLLSWIIYMSHIDDVTTDEKEVITMLQNEATNKFGIDLCPDAASTTAYCKFNLENFDYIHHPFSLLVLVSSFEYFYVYKNLHSVGFKLKEFGTTSYWIREVKDSTVTPLVVFHGICPGWITYDAVISEICVNRTVILYNNYSSRYSTLSYDFHVQTAHEVTSTLKGILQQHSLELVTIFGHSWGSFLAGWVIRLAPEIVFHVILADPVCLTFVLPDTTYYILYKPPENFQDYLVKYFVRGDLVITHTLHRFFGWHNFFLELSDIPDSVGVTIAMSTDDELIPFKVLSEMVDRFVEKRTASNCFHTSKIVWKDKAHAYGTYEQKTMAMVKRSIFECDCKKS